MDQSDTPSTGNPPDPLAAHRQAEIAKLRAETKALEKSHVSERLKIVATAFTTFVALSGVYLTFRSQINQAALAGEAQQQAREAQQDDFFASLISQFGEESVKARVAAATGLAIYLNPEEYPRYHRYVVSLFLSAARIEPNDELRNGLRDLLAQNASDSSILALVDQNRLLQDELAIALKKRVAYLKGAEWPVAPDWADSAAGIVFKNLRWNIETLIGSLNAKDTLRNLDLSNVILSMATSDKSSSEDSSWTRPLATTTPLEAGLVFDSVNLRGSVMSWLVLEDCRFYDVQLDSAFLVGTQFNRCKFGADSLGHRDEPISLRDFSTVSSQPDEKRRVFAARWIDTELRASIMASETSTFDCRSPYFSFRRTRWHLDSVTDAFREQVALEQLYSPDSLLEGTGRFDALPRECQQN